MPDDKEHTYSAEEAQLLKETGYEVTLKREFSFWTAFGVAFVIISPIVALYGVFGLGLVTGGPAFWWTFPLTLIGQLLTALVFAELGSRYPLAGGVYQWTRQAGNPRLAWFTGWSYIWCYVISITAATFIMANYFCAMIGYNNPPVPALVGISIGFVVLYTAINTIARWVLKIMLVVSIACEAIASITLATVLLIFYRENPISIIFNPIVAGNWRTYLTGGAFLGALAFVGWSFIGFEAAGTISEEVKNPQRAIPKAIVLSLVVVAATVMYSSLALILATPNIEQVVRKGDIADPIVYTLTYHFGDAWARPFFGLVVLGFLAGQITCQTAVSRATFSWARDGLIPASSFLSRVSRKQRLPINAIVTTGVLIVVLYALAGVRNAWEMLLSATVILFYTSFMLGLVGAFIARLTGRWQPGEFNLGRIGGWTTNLLALLWTGFMIVIIAWPRYPDLPWYQNWAVLILMAVLTAAGVISFFALQVPKKVETAKALLSADADPAEAVE